MAAYPDPPIELAEWRLLDSAIHADQAGELTPDDIANFDVRIQAEFSSNEPERFVRILLTIRAEGQSEAQTPVGASGFFRIEFHFFVENLPEALVDEAAESRLALTLVSTAYATTRGILLLLVQNTIFSNFTLALVDPRNLLTPRAEPPPKRPGRPRKPRPAAE